jgi:FkbM family methyltransferase
MLRSKRLQKTLRKSKMELIKTANGFQYVIYPDDFIGRCLKHCGYFAPTEIFFLEKLIAETDNVMEIGANIGSHCVPLATKNRKGKYICFEPQLDIYKMLVSNTVLNGHTHVTSYNYGIGDKDTTIFYNDKRSVMAGNRGAFSILTANSQGDANTFLKVRKLDYFEELQSLKSLKLIKIDVEGMECTVTNSIKPFIVKHQPILFIEYTPTTFFELVNIVKSLDYDVFYFVTSSNEYDILVGKKDTQQRVGDTNILCYPKNYANDIPSFLIRVGDEIEPRVDAFVTIG